MALSRIGAAFVVLALFGELARSARGQDLIGELADGSVGGLFGGACTGIGDVDGDGVPDLLVGAMYADTSNGKSGQAFVFSGATLGLLYTLDGGDAGGVFGYCVSGLPDIDGDGVGDVMVGMPMHTGAAGVITGGVSVYSGKTGQLIRSHDGEFMGNRFGSCIAAIGDVDADGVADYLVGDPDFTSSTNVITGRVYAYSGNSGALLFDLTGWNDNQSFGNMLTRTGDLDADGVDDIAVASEDSARGGGSGRGRIDVYSGSTQQVITSLIGAPPDDAGIGKALTGGSDFDGDGVPDLVVGDPDHLVNGVAVGSVVVYSSATWTPIFTWYGRNSSDRFGVSVSCVGDASADGVPDLLIGSGIGYKRHGNAYLYSGRSGHRLSRFVADTPATGYGYSVGAAGDITGDGRADLLVGAVLDSKLGFEVGRVFVYSGNDLFLDSNGTSFAAGARAEFDWHCPSASSLSALAVVAVSSNPTFTIVDLGLTDSLGERSISATVPSGLAGVDASLEAFAIDPNLGLIESAVVSVSFQ
jgi:hypothetical protein